jgi:hypothetical protein
VGEELLGMREILKLSKCLFRVGTPAERQLLTLNDLFDQAREAGTITTPEIKNAS